jgi:hypothetical protein
MAIIACTDSMIVSDSLKAGISTETPRASGSPKDSSYAANSTRRR